MKTPFLFLCLILSVILSGGCSKAEKNETAAMDSVQYAEASIEEEHAGTEPQLVQTERMLIKNGNIRFECSNIKETRRIIAQAVKTHNGYIASDEESRYDDNINNVITVRIPNSGFDNFLADATEGISRFDSKEINTRDVTSEFLDMQARLKTKKELESRYLELLKKATKISEMLEIERSANNLRSEIESIEGQLKYLNNQVDYSTLTISFYEKTPGTSDFFHKLTDGFGSGWDYFISFFILLVNIWPFLLLIAAFIIIVQRRKNKKKRDK